MNVLTEADSSTPGQADRVVFLYTLVPGYAAPSFGIHCAQLAGVGPDILQRAKQVLEHRSKGSALEGLKSERQAAMEARYKHLLERLMATDLRTNSRVQQLLDDAAQPVAA